METGREWLFDMPLDVTGGTDNGRIAYWLDGEPGTALAREIDAVLRKVALKYGEM